MNNIYFFNSHGARNGLDRRVEIPEQDHNIYITLAYPGYTITSYELLVCLCAFKDERFVEWFNSSIDQIKSNSIPDFKELYLFERTVESHMIQAGWAQANYFLSQPNASTYSDFDTITKLVKSMSNFVRPDGGINEDFYKHDTAFFLTFYFRNPTFNLSIADYKYSTHIYSSVTTERSGLNSMGSYNYNLSIDIPERKFQCDHNGKMQVNKLIRQMYSSSLLPTKQELKRRFKLECIDNKHLAVSNYSIDSTAQFINYVGQRLPLLPIPNIIFMANCSTVQGLDEESIRLVRRGSISLRPAEDLPLEFSPQIKTSQDPVDNTTFNKPKPSEDSIVTSESDDNYVVSEPDLEPGSDSEPDLDPGSRYEPSPQYTDMSDYEFWSRRRLPTKYESKLGNYKLNTKKVYEDKKKLAKKTGSSNIIVSIDGNMLISNAEEIFEPKHGDKFFILSQKTLDRKLTKIIVDGLTQTIKLNIPVTPELIITYWLIEYFKSIQHIFNKLKKVGYEKASDFYNQYLCRINSDYKNEIMDMFVELNELEIVRLGIIVNNPTDSINFRYIQTFVRSEYMQQFIYETLGLIVEPTNLNYKISHKFSFSNITNGKWDGRESTLTNPINYWFIKISEPDYNIQVITQEELSASKYKSKYLKYKEKYLNLSKQARSL